LQRPVRHALIQAAIIAAALCSNAQYDAALPRNLRPIVDAAAFIHRLGSTLNHRLHFHGVVIYGVFDSTPPAESSSTPLPDSMHQAPPPCGHIYGSILETASKIYWCSTGAGDDPAGIIGNRCEVYSDCLETAGLTEMVDKIPFPPLSEEQRSSVRRCHQALYNAARTNPQIKGARATQIWLERDVFPGTEAKSFSVPKTMQPRR